MAGLKQQCCDHLVKSPVQMNRSVNCSKLYGIVELEIEVTELLENISTALYYLQKLDLFSATNCELRIFQKDVTILADAVTNLKYKIQKTFKNISFQEDIQYLTSSKEIVHGKNSMEMIDKAKRNIREPKELDETQSEPTIFHRRFAAGSSIIASGGEHLLITEKTKEKVMPKGRKKKPGETQPNDFKEIVEDSDYNHLKSKKSINLSSYDFSNNSEISTFTFSWRGKTIKKRRNQEI